MTLRRPLRVLLRVAAVTATLALAAAGAAFLWLRSTLPQRDGTLVVPGVSALTTIDTDAHGVPHIEAATLEDGAFALGWVHAQDRFFQMDLARRLVRGRLSELFGSRTLGLDRRARRLGFARYLQGELDALDPTQLHLLERYAQGVNAAIAHDGAPWALRLLRAGPPAPWTPLDTAALVIYMDDRLTEDGDEELRAETAAAVGARTAAWLLDVEPEDTPAIADDGDAGIGAGLPASPARMPGPPAAGSGARGAAHGRTGWLRAERDGAVGSNAWAVDRRWTAGSGPLLCNDTHLMHALPALFHTFEVRLPGKCLAGFAIPGAPLAVIGTNGALAWGVTTLYDDAVDYLLEEFVGQDSTQVRRAAGTEPVRWQWDRIAVRGQPCPDSLLVRWTEQGPLVALGGTGRLATRRWVRETGGGTLAAMFRLQEATSLEAARAALSTYAGPGQNFVLADTLGPFGRVGWVPAGRWPRRQLAAPLARGSGPGRAAVPGAAPAVAPADVPGALPSDGAAVPVGLPPLAEFSTRPTLIPSPGGCVITANQRAARGDAGLQMTPRWPLPWRAMRLRERLERERPWTAQRMSSLQMDAVVESARRFSQWMARTPPPPGAAPQVLSWWNRLSSWDGAMSGDERPTLWRAVMDRLQVELFADDWPRWVRDVTPERWGAQAQPLPLERATLRVLGLLGGAPSAAPDDSLDGRDWVDDRRTPARETPADIVARALGWGLAALGARYGADPVRWRWDRVHTVTLEHPLAELPVLGHWLRLGPAAVPGDRHAVCANAARDAADLKVDTIPVMRIVIDLGAPQASRFILSSGESEHPMSPSFADQFPRWVRGEMLPLLAAADPARRGGHRLMLAPPARSPR